MSQEVRPVRPDAILSAGVDKYEKMHGMQPGKLTTSLAAYLVSHSCKALFGWSHFPVTDARANMIGIICSDVAVSNGT